PQDFCNNLIDTPRRLSQRFLVQLMFFFRKLEIARRFISQRDSGFFRCIENRNKAFCNARFTITIEMRETSVLPVRFHREGEWTEIGRCSSPPSTLSSHFAPSQSSACFPCDRTRNHSKRSSSHPSIQHNYLPLRVRRREREEGWQEFS
ncbi:hypothetical protein PMAYCL1PPCAC_29709, partial [Pristionchus mayeri]